MLSANFEFFELLCVELSGRADRVLTNEDLGVGTEERTGGKLDDVLDNLREEHSQSDNQKAIAASLKALEEHFEVRNSELPFTYDLNKRHFVSRDAEFIKFIAAVSSKRSSGGSFAKDFENATCERLAKKVTGTVHNVGWPRLIRKSAPAYKRYLKTLGFDNRVILGEERDGGFDILWFPPLGAHPVAPTISLQCKNGFFSRSVARESVGRTAETLLCHRMLRGNGVHLSAIVFNDYIEPDRLPNKPIAYVPLGLSDLAAVRETKLDSI